jgi:predicted phosphodiesterase
MTSISFQVFSDLHLDDKIHSDINFETRFPRKKDVDILFLAGDIGLATTEIYKRFFEYVSSEWKHIFYVLGNHEYYISSGLKISIGEVLRLYKDYFKINFPNVRLLERSSTKLYIGNGKMIRILGCTLWSRATPKTMHLTQSFSKILNERLEYITCREYNALNRKSHEWLLNSLYIPSSFSSTSSLPVVRNLMEENDDDKTAVVMATIVLTHFPTCRERVSHPFYERTQTEEQKDLFTNDMIDPLPRRGKLPNVFIAGHTHYSYEFFKNRNHYISNQLGREEDGDTTTRFNPDGVYTVYV